MKKFLVFIFFIATNSFAMEGLKNDLERLTMQLHGLSVQLEKIPAKPDQPTPPSAVKPTIPVKTIGRTKPPKEEEPLTPRTPEPPITFPSPPPASKPTIPSRASQESIDKRLAIPDRSVHTLYGGSHGGLPLYIPKKQLIDATGNPVNLKELLEGYIVRGSLSEVTSILIDQAEKSKEEFEKPHPLISSLNELPKLLSDAKSLLKSFLLTDDNELPYLKENYILKTDPIGRLFTYAKLERVIEEKKLKHIQLPRKVLVIRDWKTGKHYVSSKEAPKIIDDILQYYLNIDSRRGAVEYFGHPLIKYSVGYDIDTYPYELVLFAHKEPFFEGGSEETLEELKILCQEAPFDIGYNNIFFDAKGDAVIIDTEYKNTPIKDCKKLKRYPVTH